MSFESGSSMETSEYWERIVVFGLAFLSVLLPSGILTGPSPVLILISAIISLVVAFVATVVYDRLLTEDSNRRSAFWTGVATAYPVAFGIYVAVLFSGVITGAQSTTQAIVVVVAACIGIATAAIRVRYRD